MHNNLDRYDRFSGRVRDRKRICRYAFACVDVSCVHKKPHTITMDGYLYFRRHHCGKHACCINPMFCGKDPRCLYIPENK